MMWCRRLVAFGATVAVGCAIASAQQPDDPPPPSGDAELRRELDALLEAARARRDGRTIAPDARSKLALSVIGWRDLLERGDRLPGRVVHHALDVLTRLVVDGEAPAARAAFGTAAEALAHCYAPRPRGYGRLVARTLARAALLDDRNAKAALLARGLVACLVGAEPVRVERVGRGLAALGSRARFVLPTLERVVDTLGDDGGRALEPALSALRRAGPPVDTTPPIDVFEGTVRTADRERGTVVLAVESPVPLPVGTPLLVLDAEGIAAVGVVDQSRAGEASATILSAAGPDAIASGQPVVSL